MMKRTVPFTLPDGSMVRSAIRSGDDSRCKEPQECVAGGYPLSVSRKPEARMCFQCRVPKGHIFCPDRDRPLCHRCHDGDVVIQLDVERKVGSKIAWLRLTTCMG